MRISRLILAVALSIIGLIWIGQGSGIIAGSAMSGTAFWAVAGLLAVVAAVALVVNERRRTARPQPIPFRSGESGARR